MLLTGQGKCYDVADEIQCPDPGDSFYGQDAHYGSMASFRIDQGTVIAENTGLMWQRENDNTRRSWHQAAVYCESLELNGYQDWRLPAEGELISLLDYGRFSPAIDEAVFPGTKSSFYWTATDHVENPESAWVVLFSYGYVFTRDKSDDGMYVRCVRGHP